MAMKNFVSGEVLTESDLDIYCVNMLAAVKTATESVTSSTTLQDDDALSVTVEASSYYMVRTQIRYDGDAAADIKIALIGPASAVFSGHCIAQTTTAAAVTDIGTSPAMDINTAYNFGTRGAGSAFVLDIHGMLNVAGTAGTFKLQWAQVTSNAVATRVFNNSFIALQRIF